MANPEETTFTPDFTLVAVGDFNYAITPVVTDINNSGWVEPVGFINNDGTLSVDTASGNYDSLITSYPERAQRDNLAADYFNTGNVDIFSNVYTLPTNTNSYYVVSTGNGTGSFSPSDAIGNEFDGFGETLVTADFFNDSRLDVFGPRYTYNDNGNDNYFFVNNGNGTFTDEGAALGVGMPDTPEQFRPEGAEAVDYFKTGWIDLYVAGNFYENENGTFVNVSEQLGLTPQFDEGAQFADLLDNGYLDLVLKVPNVGIRIYWGGPNGFTGPTYLTLDSVTSGGGEGGLGENGLNVYDILGNGYPDIITSTADGAGIYWNYGNGDFVYEPLGTNVGLADLFAFGDFENNDNIDIVARINGEIDVLDTDFNAPTTAFNVTLLDANGLEDEFGRTFTITPLSQNGTEMTGVVDGGSGYLSQDQYTVLMHSPWAGLNKISVYFTATPDIVYAAGTANITAYASGNFTMAGTGVDNVLIGGPGNDTLSGGGGINTIEGGGGTDTVDFTGPQADYGVALLSNGALQITDLRSGSPDGVSTVSAVASFQFTDGTLTSQQMTAKGQTAGASFTLAAPFYGELSVNENVAVALASFVNVAGDADTGDQLSVQLSVSDGTLSFNGTSGATLTLTGTAARVNQDLASTTYKGNTDFYGSDALSVTAKDVTHSSLLAGVAIVAPIMVLSTAVLTNTGPAQYIANAGDQTNVTGITVADTPNVNNTLTLRMWVLHGTLSADGQSGLQLLLTGTAAQLNSFLTNATYTANAGFQGIDTLALTTTDPGGTESTPTTIPIDVFNATIVEDPAVTVSAGGLNGNGTNALVITTGGAVNLSGVTGFPTINFALQGNAATVSDNTLAGAPSVTISGGTGNNSVNASGDTAASAGKQLSYVAGPGTDTFTGGFENDTVTVAAAALANDPLTGGSGTNTLVIATAGPASLANVTGFPTVDFAPTGNSVTLTDHTFGTQSELNLIGAINSNNNVNASGDTAASAGKNLFYVASGQVDTFTGGFENDILTVPYYSLAYDTLTGGSGTNTLVVYGTGAADLGGISGFKYVYLDQGGNAVTVTDATLAAVSELGIYASSSGNNSISAADDTAASVGKRLLYSAGSGTDTFIGGFEDDLVYVPVGSVANDTLTGGSGTNDLVIEGAGAANLSRVSGFGTIYLDPGGNQVTAPLSELESDTFVSGGGVNTLTIVGAGAANFANVSGFSTITLDPGGNQLDVPIGDLPNETFVGKGGVSTLVINGSGAISLALADAFNYIYLDPGGNQTTVSNATLAGRSETSVFARGGSNSLDASGDTDASAGKRLLYFAGPGLDYFKGGFENDLVYVPVASLEHDGLQGGSGSNVLVIEGAGAGGLAGVSGFGTIWLDPGGNTVSLNDTTLAGLSTVAIVGQGGNNIVNASPDTAASAGKQLTYFAGPETDSFTGGFENDRLYVQEPELDDDELQGGSGVNTLIILGGGDDADLDDVVNFNYIYLDPAGDDATVTDETLEGRSQTTIIGRGGENSVDASSDTAASDGRTLLYFAGPGTDTFVGGFENDLVYVPVAAADNDMLTGGSGTNSLILKGGGTVDLNVSNFNYIYLDPAGDAVTITDTTLAGRSETSVFARGGDNSVNASGDTAASTGKRLLYFAGANADTFTGGSENDLVYVPVAAVGNDTLTGGVGINDLVIKGAGIADLSGVSGFGKIYLAPGGDTVNVPLSELPDETFVSGGGVNSLVIDDSGSLSLAAATVFDYIYLAPGGDAARVTDATLAGRSETSVFAQGGNNTVNASGDSAASAGKRLLYFAGPGSDTFAGGFENDLVYVPITAVSNDILLGGSGSNVLVMEGGGSGSLAEVSGYSTIYLDPAGDTLSLGDKALSGLSSVTVHAQGGNNTVNAASDTSASAGKTLTYEAGPGTDKFIGGFENDTIFFGGGSLAATGGSGRDEFLFTTPSTGTNTIADFTHSVDEVVFLAPSFDLGVDNGKATSTPQAIAPSLFSSNNNGTFASSTNRFAYNHSTGALYYSANGSGGSAHLIASFSGDPTLTASDLYFVS